VEGVRSGCWTRANTKSTFQPEPGDTIVLYSDGITDHLNAAGRNSAAGAGAIGSRPFRHATDELIGAIQGVDKFSLVAFRRPDRLRDEGT